MKKNQTKTTTDNVPKKPKAAPSEPVVKLATEPEKTVTPEVPETPVETVSTNPTPVEAPVATVETPVEPVVETKPVPEQPVVPEPVVEPAPTPVEVPVAPVQSVQPVQPIAHKGANPDVFANLLSKFKSFGIGPIVTIAVVAVALVGVIVFTVVSSSPKSVFKSAINKVYKISNTAIDSYETYLKEYDLTENSAYFNASFAMKTNVEDLKEAGVNDLSLTVDGGVDYKNELLSLGAELKGKKEKISLDAQYITDEMYVKSSLFEEVLKIDSSMLSDMGVEIDFDEIKEEIKEYEKEYDTDPETYAYLLKTIKNAIVKAMDSEYIEKENEEIDVLDKEIKVKKYSYIFDEDALQDMVEKVAEYLLEQDDFDKKLADATGQDKGDIKDLLKEAKKSAKDIELDEDMSINIYTKGLFNSIVGFGLEYDGKEYVSVYTDGKNAEITIDNHEDDDYSSQKIVIAIEADGKGYKVEVKENKEKILKIDVKEATEEKIDFKLTAYEDKEEMAIIDLYLTGKQKKETYSGEYKVKLTEPTEDEYMEFSGKYTLTIKDKLEKMSGTKKAVSAEELDTDKVKEKIDKISEKDENLGNLVEGAISSLEEEMLDLNYIGMVEVTPTKAESLLKNKKATVLYIGDTYYSYYYDEEANELLDNLETLQYELDFYSYYLDEYDVTSELEELLGEQVTNCVAPADEVTEPTEPSTETPSDNVVADGETETEPVPEVETPTEPSTNCVPTTPTYPAIYLIKDGKIQKAFNGTVSYDDLKAALEEIGIK